MISKSDKEEILSNLIGLGIMFIGKRPDFRKSPIAPEQAIVRALSYAKEDFLVLHLLHNWIKRHHDLIHADLLKKQIQTVVNKVDIAILGGLLAYTEDKRFNVIVNKIRRIKNEQNSEIEKSISFAAKIGQFPYDKVMSRFGVMITELTIEQDNKKILNQNKIAEINPFIKCRLLFGSNARADVAALMSLGVSNPSEVKHILNFSYETAHRNFCALKSANWPSIINFNLETEF